MGSYSAQDFGYTFLTNTTDTLDDHEKSADNTGNTGNQEILVEVNDLVAAENNSNNSNISAINSANNNNHEEMKYHFAPDELDFDFMRMDSSKNLGNLGTGDNGGMPPGGRKMTAAASSFCTCLCCCLLFVLALLPGLILLLVANSKDDRTYLMGSILMVLSLGACLFGTICFCCCCLLSCTDFDSFTGDKKSKDEIKLTLKRLNDKFSHQQSKLNSLHLDLISNHNLSGLSEIKSTNRNIKSYKTTMKQQHKAKVQNQVKQLLAENDSLDLVKRKIRPICFVVRFEGGMNCDEVEVLREQISLIVKLGAKGVDRAVVLITSPGGAAHMYGLAAAQLVRIKNAGMKLLVCVDAVAASGGYMMASVADEIYAAPFSIVGSIGVISIIPNIEQLLQRHNIETHVMTSGKYKNTVNVVGEVTPEGKAKFIEEMDKIHTAFKEHIVLNRSKMRENIEDIATGEAFMAVEAKKLGLVDHICTSDELLMKLSTNFDIIEVKEKPKNKFASFADDFGTSFGRHSSGFLAKALEQLLPKSYQPQKQLYSKLSTNENLAL